MLGSAIAARVSDVIEPSERGGYAPDRCARQPVPANQAFREYRNSRSGAPKIAAMNAGFVRRAGTSEAWRSRSPAISQL
jgi:hypothetical protein